VNEGVNLQLLHGKDYSQGVVGVGSATGVFPRVQSGGSMADEATSV